jgi:hypothetical protein
MDRNRIDVKNHNCCQIHINREVASCGGKEDEKTGEKTEEVTKPVEKQT